MNQWETLERVPREELTNRIAKLQSRLQAADWDGVLVTQNVGIYYLSGSMQTGYLYVPQSGEPILYIKRSLERAKYEAGGVKVEPMGSFRDFGKTVEQHFGTLQKVGIELDVLPVQQYHRIQSVFPKVEWQDSSSILREQRTIKSEYELQQIRKAAHVVNEAIQEVLPMIKPGTRDIDVAAAIEHEIRLRDHIGIMRMRSYNQELCLGMVVSGEAASTPTYFDGPAGGTGLSTASPQGAGRKEIRENEPIMIDISACIEGYIVDQTRMVVVGKLEDELQKAYEVAYSIIKRVESEGVPGVAWESLYQLSLEMAHEAGLTEHYMGFGADQVKFLGHGVGLELDEYPILARGFKQTLEVGMVIAIEPKFTFPGRGVVGIENTYLVTDKGLQSLCVTPEMVFELAHW
jgi:Xaa-Pro dipeptidase